MTSDNFKNFDACHICLHTLEEPVVCQKGHMYCKGCVYENMLAQKDGMKKQLKAHNDQVAKREILENSISGEDAKRVKEMEKFAKTEGSISGASTRRSADIETKVPVGYKEVLSDTGKISYIPDPKFVKEHMMSSATMSKETKLERSAMLPSFWLPTMTPEEGEKTIAKPSEHTTCPAGGHFLRLKQLRPLKFSYASQLVSSSSLPSSSSSSSSSVSKKEAEVDAPVCSACRKQFMKSSKAFCLRTCGHVVCHICYDAFITKDNSCVECSTAVEMKDVVKLEAGGSSFAAGGAQTVKTTITAAFNAV